MPKPAGSTFTKADYELLKQTRAALINAGLPTTHDQIKAIDARLATETDMFNRDWAAQLGDLAKALNEKVRLFKSDGENAIDFAGLQEAGRTYSRLITEHVAKLKPAAA